MCAKKKQTNGKIQLEFSFKLIAVSSALNLNKMLWTLNHDLNWNLAKLQDSEVNYGYPIFSDSSTFSPAMVALIPNKQFDGSTIEKKLPNVDYIIEISGEMSPETFSEIIKHIKQNNDIQAAIEVAPKTIKREIPFFPQ